MKVKVKMKWINVKTKLPEKNQKVLCIQDPNKTATREPLFSIFDGDRFLVPNQQNSWIDKFLDQNSWSDIIYWMHLPKTPKQLN